MNAEAAIISLREHHPHLAERTARTETAQVVGRSIMGKSRWARAAGFIPVFFGVMGPGVLDAYVWEGLTPFQFDEKERGFIAQASIKRDAGLLRELLEVSQAITEGAPAYNNLPQPPVRGEKVVLRRTKLTPTDGIVWFEIIGINGAPRSPYLLMFSQTHLGQP